MRRQKKQMALVLACLILFGAAYAGMRAYNADQEKKEKEREEGAKVYVTEAEEEDVTAFSYQVKEETLEFVKEGEEWALRQDEGAKLDQDAVQEIVSSLARLEAEDQILDVSEEDAAKEYGFSSPQNMLTLTTADGTETLSVGMDNAVTGQCYVRKKGDGAVYLVDGSFPSAFQKTGEELEKKEDGTEAVSETEVE